MPHMIYSSLRVGKNGRLFHLYKLRTFKEGRDGGVPTAAGNDERMTDLGKFLRKTKLDELPTLFNLLTGDILLVGPRPDVPSEINGLDLLVRLKTLAVKPGIFSPATLWNSNEDELLKNEPDPHQAYLQKIKPTKYKLNCWYVDNKSIALDFHVIIRSVAKILRLPWFQLTIDVDGERFVL